MLKLLNSMNMKKVPLKPLEPGRIKIFTCGPSIYQRPHIGNYRTFLYEDVLIRYLEYGGNQVKRIINLTDIEDKSIEEAHSRGEKMEDLTSNALDYFKKETGELKIKLPDVLPASSTTIEEAAEITLKLIEKGYAYRHPDGIFFDPLKVKDFGKLFKLDMSRWPEKKFRFKRDTYNGNRWNLGDFILWHADKGEHIHFWDSVVGRGRPSWNIQDPAIIHKHLGDQVDINCGGIDNIYRHHDYNIALMEALTGKEYARIYLHGEHLVVNGKTMSKSRGNILYPEQVYEKGYTPGELRFFLIASTHYRKKLNFTWKNMEEKSERLREIKQIMKSLTSKNTAGTAPGRDNPNRRKAEETIRSILPVFEEKMNDDMHLAHGVDWFEKALKDLAGLFPRGLDEKSAGELKKSAERMDEVLRCLL